MHGGWSRSVWLASVALGCFALAGCAHFKVPAIDPSGERLFVPGGSTTLESCSPKPAFTAPPKPAPCPASALGATAPTTYAPTPPCGPNTGTVGTAAVAGTCGTGSLVGGRNLLKVTPARLVAPVGSEVVLVAGFCGPDGHFVMKQNLEWTLAQDSVGHFVEVGGGHHACFQSWYGDTPDKRSSNYALNRTFTESRVLTRGTSNPNDDVRVGRGQAWISLTSPTEGTSHVTVLAPEVEQWDRRRQTATVHWIDAQWQFPGPVVTGAGQPVTLVTAVTRATNGSPHEGWIVRYSVPETANAVFSNGSHEVEVPTDANGQAAVEFGPRTNDGSTVHVNIQIVRPAQASGDLPKTVVGQGGTSVTWSAPGLSLRVLGPEAVALGQNVTFRIEVTNMGDLPARDVVVSDALPPTLKFVSSNPPGQAFADRMEWRLGDLPAKLTRPIDVTAQAVRAGDVRYTVRARSADGLATEQHLDRLRITAPTLQLEVTGPAVADVGSEAQFAIRVTNRGTTPLRNVQIVDQFDPGLAHAQGQRSPISLPLGDLAVNESREVAVTFVVRQAGQLCHTVQVFAEGGQSTSSRKCLTGRNPVAGGAGVGPAPANALRVQLAGSRQATVGQNAEYTFTVMNLAATPLTNVRVVFAHDASLVAAEASDGFQAAVGSLTWNVGVMQRDERREYRVICRCVAAAAAANVRAIVTADPNLQQSEAAVTSILAAGAAGPGGNAGDPAANVAGPGSLSVTVTDRAPAVQVGAPTRYIILVKNNSNAPDRNVVLSFRLSPGIDITKVKATGPSRTANVSADGRTWQMAPVAEMRADETLVPYYVDVVPQAPGKIAIEVEVTSARQATPVRAVDETVVVGQ